MKSKLNLQPYLLDAFASDEPLVLLDPTDVPGQAMIDVAIGRMPAGSLDEAAFLVRKTMRRRLSEALPTPREKIHSRQIPGETSQHTPAA